MVGLRSSLPAGYDQILDLQLILVFLKDPSKIHIQGQNFAVRKLLSSTKLDEGKLTESVSEATEAQDNLCYSSNPPLNIVVLLVVSHQDLNLRKGGERKE